MDFEWDESKAGANNKKHGATFWEATEVFGDDFSSFVADPDHSAEEVRFLLFVTTNSNKHLVVSFTEQDQVVRIISARRMTPSERKAYEQ